LFISTILSPGYIGTTVSNTHAMLGMDHMKCLARETVQISLTKILITSQLRNLLHKIHQEYPQVFTKARLDAELDNIHKQVQVMHIGIIGASGKVLYSPKLKIPVTIRLKPEVAQELMNIQLVNPAITSLEPVKEIKVVAPEDKCLARVYTPNSIIYQSTDNPQITLYGRQCKARHMNGSMYCGLHNKHRPHGIWGQDPESHIKAHFQRHYDSAIANGKINSLVPSST
jgi:hypothetical protein